MATPSQIDARKHITETYQALTTNERWCEDMYDVEKHSTTLLANGLFFSELLQNADDAKAGWIDCRLEGSFMIFAHDGNHFNRGNVEKIIRFANSTILDKSQSPDATGYKGIGFKSLGTIAQQITILSEPYRFRFDQSHWQGQRKPWQMIPIWTEERDLPPALKSPLAKIRQIKPQAVIFIFGLKDLMTVQENLKAIPEHSFNRFLFTRKVAQVDFFLPQSHQVVREYAPAGANSHFRNIRINGVEKCQFRVFSFTIPIPATVSQQLQTLDSSICPSRLKEAKEIQIDYALPTENGVLAEKKSLKLFCTFPTQVELGVPFIINTEFLIKPDRQGLYCSAWNAFLIESLLFNHFSVLHALASDRTHRKKVLLLLAPAFLHQSDIAGIDYALCQAYRKGFEAGAKTKPFIPSFADPNALLAIEGCLVDHTGFFAAFRDAIPTMQWPKNLAHPDLEGIAKLETIAGVRVLRFASEIIDLLVSLCEQNRNPPFCLRVLQFLSQKFPYDINAFKDKKFILTEDGTLSSLSELSLPGKGQQVTPPAFISLSVLHPEVLKLDTKGTIAKWLIEKGCLPLSAAEIVRKKIQPLALAGNLDREKNLELLRYLFRLFCEKLIKPSDFECLREMKVFTLQRNLSMVSDLYLCSAYDPAASLEEIFSAQGELFVSSIYMEDPQLRFFWRDFFSSLGVKRECQLEFPLPSTIDQLKKKKIYGLAEYMVYLHSGQNPVIGRGSIGSDELVNFIFFPLIEYLPLKRFSEHFWRAVNHLGKKWTENDKMCQFRSPNRHAVLAANQKKSYLQYILTTKKLVRGTDGQLHTSNELYSPRLKSAGVSADIEVELDDEIARHLGFKTTLDLAECIQQLKKLREEERRDLAFYAFLLKNLMQTQPQIEGVAWHFLAADNSWQPVNSLKYCKTDIEPTHEMAKFWFKNVLPADEMSALAARFKCPVVEQLVDLTAIEGVEPDSDFRDLFIKRLPLFAWMYAKEQAMEEKTYLFELALKVKKLQFLRAKKLPSQGGGKGSQKTLLYQCRLYYVKGWKAHKPAVLKLIADYLAIDQKGKDLLQTILDLKDLTREGRHHTTVAEYCEEHQIPREELLALLNDFDFTPDAEEPVPPTSAAESIQSDHPLPHLLEEKETGMTEEDDLTSLFKALGISQTPAETVVGESPAKSKVQKLSAPKQRGGEELEAREWKPEVEVKTASLARSKMSKMTNPAPVPAKPVSLKPSSGEKKVRAKLPLSDQAKAKIGRWGEEFVFDNLKLHYQEKQYQADPVNAEAGLLRLAKGDRTITIKWMNCAAETQNPYDLLITKSKSGQETVNYVEVKASKGKKVRFFLSENEMGQLQANPLNYRLFFVPKAGTEGASVMKISNLNAWIQENRVSIKEHKTFEVTI